MLIFYHMTHKEYVFDPNKNEIDPYGPEAIRREVEHKSKTIRQWAKESGLEEGKDFFLIGNISDVVDNVNEVQPHETKGFFVGVLEAHYPSFRDYILGKYKDERKRENPKGEVRLDYSWGGRFAVGWDGVPFDTVSVQSVKDMTARTRHQEFCVFFKEQTGFDFPTAETLNRLIREIAEQSLPAYNSMLEKLIELKNNKHLPDDGYRLTDLVTHNVNSLTRSLKGDAVHEFPETIEGVMPVEMRAYADFTYNAEDMDGLSRAMQITGVTVPEDQRLDRIFERLYGWDSKKMEDICRRFSQRVFPEKSKRDTVSKTP